MKKSRRKKSIGSKTLRQNNQVMKAGILVISVLALIFLAGMFWPRPNVSIICNDSEGQECEDCEEECEDCEECLEILTENLTMRVDLDYFLTDETNITFNGEGNLLSHLRNDGIIYNMTITPTGNILLIFDCNWFNEKAEDIIEMNLTYEIKFNQTSDVVYEVGYLNISEGLSQNPLFLVNTFGDDQWHNQSINLISHPSFNLTAITESGFPGTNALLGLYFNITASSHWQPEDIEVCLDELYISMLVKDVSIEDLENFY